MFRKPANAPRKNKRIIKKDVPNFRSRYIPKKEHKKIGTIMLIPNCEIVVRERYECLFFFINSAPFLSIFLLYSLFPFVSSNTIYFFMSKQVVFSCFALTFYS